MSRRNRNRHHQAPPDALAVQAPETVVMENSAPPVQNGLAGALGFEGGMGIGGGFAGGGYPFQPGVAQVSQPGTIFRNLRWYLVSNYRQVLNEAYVEIGLVQTIVDVPVDDALRGGIEIKSAELGEEGVAELLVAIDRDDDLGTIGQTAKWNRLFGGAGVLIITDQDPMEPLDVESLTGEDKVEFRACDLWELTWDAQNVGGYSPTEDEEQFEFYSYYGQKVHKSRVLAMKGKQAPSFIRPRLRGWGFSVVEALVRSLNQYLKGTDLTFEVLDEFKLDIFKIKGLTDALMSPQGEEAIRRRLQLANFQKNYQNALSMDAEDDFDHKQLSFSGLAEASQGIRMQVASDMRMPLTKLFGISAAGFNSGEDDLEVYNAMVESEVRQKLKYDLLRMLEIKCQILFGYIPDDLSITFKPLRVLSADVVETVKTQKFTRLFQAKSAGELTTKEFREACNKGELFDITLDTDVEEMGIQEDEGATDEDEAEQGSDKPAAGKPESAKSKLPKDKPDPKEPKKAENSRPRPKDRFGDFAPFTRGQRVVRMVNSPQFDKASYEADGGDSWIDPRRKELFMNPGNVDEALWAKAKEASQAAFGEVRWQFVTWWYKKQGGHFQ